MRPPVPRPRGSCQTCCHPFAPRGCRMKLGLAQTLSPEMKLLRTMEDPESATATLRQVGKQLLEAEERVREMVPMLVLRSQWRQHWTRKGSKGKPVVRRVHRLCHEHLHEHQHQHEE